MKEGRPRRNRREMVFKAMTVSLVIAFVALVTFATYIVVLILASLGE